MTLELEQSRQDRRQRLAFGMLATAVIAIVVAAVTLILRG